MACLTFSLLLVSQALTLSNEAEGSRPFASPLGQLMVTQRTSQAAAKQVRTQLPLFELSLTNDCTP